MHYEMEELLPVAAMLAEKYTSKESSSVTYENAQMLMEAVLYCIREFEGDEAALPQPKIKESPLRAWEIGYSRIIQKVYDAKKIYHELTRDFEDYGCRNFKETILHAMPGFFLYYDVRFQPQNHIITMDYPPAVKIENLCGIHLVSQYLDSMILEQQFLQFFEPEAVRTLLRKTEEHFQISYMDNLCSLVLLQAVGCLISEEPVFALNLSEKGLEAVEDYFAQDSKNKIAERIRTFIHIIAEHTGCNAAEEYLQSAGKEFAARIYLGIEYHALGAVFLC